VGLCLNSSAALLGLCIARSRSACGGRVQVLYYCDDAAATPEGQHPNHSCIVDWWQNKTAVQTQLQHQRSSCLLCAYVLLHTVRTLASLASLEGGGMLIDLKDTECTSCCLRVKCTGQDGLGIPDIFCANSIAHCALSTCWGPQPGEHRALRSCWVAGASKRLLTALAWESVQC